jgi:hypothetical protein
MVKGGSNPISLQVSKVAPMHGRLCKVSLGLSISCRLSFFNA